MKGESLTLIHQVIIATCFWEYIFSENCGLPLSWFFNTIYLLWVKERKNDFLFLSVICFYFLPHLRFQSREQSVIYYVFWRSAYENQVCIAQIVRRKVNGIWNIFQHGGRLVVFIACLLFMVVFRDFILKELYLLNISVDFQT